MKSLVGTYKLTKHGRYNAHGGFISTGNEVAGVLTYSDDGFMNVLITKRAAPESIDDIIAYAGTYSVDGEKVLHHVDIAVSERHRGKVETRLVRQDGHFLILSSEPTEQGYFEARWERLDGR